MHPSLLGHAAPGSLDREPFKDSKTHQEHLVTQQFFQEHEHLVPAVSKALRALNCVSMPCDVADQVEYWRETTAHFVRNNHHSEHDDLDPFYMVDVGRIIMQMTKFKKHLPSVQPHYAVKCNPSPAIISVLSALGCSFDCASAAELRLVLDENYASCDEVIFANPCKSVSDMRRAESMGVRFVTFDNPDELAKLAANMPSCKAVLRIKTNDSAAVCAFSTKFGASMADVPMLLRRAAELGVQVVGVSFHVGSGNNDPNAYMGSILNARSVFDQGIALGFEMKLLDLGGGFPGTEPPLDAQGKPLCLSFEEIAACIRPLLEEHFHSARVIAEPGRYFTANTHTLAMNVHSMRKVPMPDGQTEYQYYVNDGLYHSFNCIVYDHAHPELHLLHPDSESRMHISTIFGPTCDSLDCILKRQPFPELSLGEWLFVPAMGSYTTAAGAPFNGFATRRTEYICSVPLLELQ